MTATTAQAVQHEPWCTDHQETDPGAWGFCRHAFWSGKNTDTGEIEEWITLMTDKGKTFLEVCPGTDGSVTAEEARTMAAALLVAADVLEASS